jgi:pimeloyl-ACP methyl ester carboxylesterase
MPEPRRHTIFAEDGLALNVWEHEGSGPPLLLTHCTGMLGRIWDPVVRRLAGRYRVIAPDMRGHGDSALPTAFEQTHWHRCGQDVLRIVDALGLEAPLRAAGHSAGGAHLGYAEQARPGLFPRPILIEAIMTPPELYQPEHSPAASARRRINTFASVGEARVRYAAKPPMNTWHPEAFDAYLTHAFHAQPDATVALKLPGLIEAWFYDHGGACDLFAALPTLTWRPLLVAGEHSPQRVLSELQHGRIPHSELRIVSGAGHFVVQEQPDTIARMIRDWFG